MMSRFLTRTNFILAVIIALAVFLRLFRIDQLPPGLQFDQAFYVFDVIRLLQGDFHIFFPVPGGTEPLYPYLAMPGIALFGDTAVGLRLTGAIIGILTIPIVYSCARAIFHSTRVGLLTAFFTSISLWHIFFNRYGERVSLLVLWTTLVFWFFWRAVTLARETGEGRGEGYRYYLLTGLFLAFALYTYPGSRVLPIALILLALYAMLDDRKNAHQYIKGLLLTLIVAAIIFSPLAVYFIFHPDQFTSHSLDVSIFVPHGNVQPDVMSALTNNALKILGMFFIAGDSGGLRNSVPGQPVFNPIIGALFAVGVIVWLVTLFSPRSNQLNRRRAVLLAVWLAVVLAISLITDDAPNFVRTLPAMPAVMMLPAWGAIEIWNSLRAPMLRRVAVVTLSIVLIVSTSWTFRDYFVTFAESPETYYAFDTDKVELAQWINRQASTQQIFMAPLLSQIGTMSLLTRNTPSKTFESKDTIVLPSSAPGKDAVFIFPWEQTKKIESMAARLGVLGTRQDLNGSNGGKLALLYRIPVKNLPDTQNPLAALNQGGDFIKPQKRIHSVWADSIELLGYSINAADTQKRNIEVTLFFHALKSIPEDYTFSIKVRDAKERVWGQEDKWLGDNSYATTQWSPGDIIIEKFYPGLTACAPAGGYRFTVEAYNPQSMQSLGDAISVGTWQAEASQGNRLEDLEIEKKLDVQVASQVHLLGYSLTPDELHAGDPFSLSLFWHGNGNGNTSQVSVQLKNAALATTLVNAEIKIPPEDRGLCSFFDLRIPAGFPTGAAAIWVNNSKIADMQIMR
ncbi:MAG: glycosyltransferase family 39 protein [Chloroflexi bacterium]|nr:glycosyltransferase family 39 protein [Chloroflexota bacterium]